MPDWLETLEQISGGISGIPKGLAAGAVPFDAWEKVRTQDLANDRSEITLDDLRQMQAQRNLFPEFYGHAVTAQDAANRKSTATSESDIYSNQRNLSIQRALASPEVQAQLAGLDPSDPQYRDKVSAVIARFDPVGGVKAYDSFGVEKMQTRNLNEQAALAYVTTKIKEKDPGATVTRNPDGTVIVTGSMGERIPLSGERLVQLAALMGAPTPADAIYKGLESEGKIQSINIAAYKAFNEGRITPRVALDSLREERQAYQRVYAETIKTLSEFKKSDEYNQMSPEKRAEAEAHYKARLKQYEEEMLRLGNTARLIYTQSGLAGAGGNVMQGGGAGGGTPRPSAGRAPKSPVEAIINDVKGLGGGFGYQPAMADLMGQAGNERPLPANAVQDLLGQLSDLGAP